MKKQKNKNTYIVRGNFIFGGNSFDESENFVTVDRIFEEDIVVERGFVVCGDCIVDYSTKNR